MPTIQRGCSQRVITRAVNPAAQPLLALPAAGAAGCESGFDGDQIQASLRARQHGIIVYNHQADARALDAGPACAAPAGTG